MNKIALASNVCSEANDIAPFLSLRTRCSVSLQKTVDMAEQTIEAHNKTIKSLEVELRSARATNATPQKADHLQEELRTAKKQLREAEDISSREVSKLEDRLSFVCDMMESLKKVSDVM